MITISDGTTNLSFKGLIWKNRSRDKVLGGERPTLGMSLYTYRVQSSVGKEIILEAAFDSGRLKGWFTYPQVEQLMIWRDTGTELTMVFDTETRVGIIPLGGINIDPVRQFDKTPRPEEVCAGTLTILET